MSHTIDDLNIEKRREQFNDLIVKNIGVAKKCQGIVLFPDASEPELVSQYKFRNQKKIQYPVSFMFGGHLLEMYQYEKIGYNDRLVSTIFFDWPTDDRIAFFKIIRKCDF
jgi:hypothetical protein